MRIHLSRRDLLATAPIAAALASAPALAQDRTASFYKGRSISIRVPSAPGGVNDLCARLVAKYLPRYVPGSPSVTVENTPGAAGLLLANNMAHTLRNDGLTIGIIGRGAMMLAIQGDPSARFDPQKFTWLGSLSSYANDAYLFLVNSSFPAKTATDLKNPSRRAKIGAEEPSDTNLIFAVISQKALGLKIDVVRGYSGAAPMFLAMQRGELDGQVTGYSSVRATQSALWFGGKLRPLIQFGRATRLPALKDVPTGRELAPDDSARQLIEFAESPFFMALPFFAPPGVPADRAAALQSAFMHVASDADFLKETQRLNLEISPIDGNAIHALLKKAAATPRNIIDRYNDVVGFGQKSR